MEAPDLPTRLPGRRRRRGRTQTPWAGGGAHAGLSRRGPLGGRGPRGTTTLERRAGARGEVRRERGGRPSGGWQRESGERPGKRAEGGGGAAGAAEPERTGAKAAPPERVTQQLRAGRGRAGGEERVRAGGRVGGRGFPRSGCQPRRGSVALGAELARRGGRRFHPAVSSSPSRPRSREPGCARPPHGEAPWEAARGGRAFPRLSERVRGQGFLVPELSLPPCSRVSRKVRREPGGNSRGS